MKTFLRLAVLVLAGTGALALAGNALATQKLSVRQTATSMTIKVSQAQTDPQPLRITIYVPSGYSINASATAGTKIGTTTGTVFARDANIPLPLSGDVVAVPPTTNAPGCDPVPHIAVWNLALAVANNNINLPVHVDQLSGAEAALGSYKLVVCLAPDDVPVGTPAATTNVSFSAQLSLGTNALSVTATDTATNSATCSTTITVVDTTPPVIESVSASPNDALGRRGAECRRYGRDPRTCLQRRDHAQREGDEQGEADRARVGQSHPGRSRRRRRAGEPLAEREVALPNPQ